MKKLNVGIIGAGTMCRAHSLGYAAMPMHFPDASAVPVRKVLCDINDELARQGAERYGWEESMSDWRELVARPDIDVIDVVVPNDLHLDICSEAAKNGKMIYCEKPLGLSFEDSLEIYHTIEKYGVRNAIAFNKRRWPAVMFAHKLIKAGVIGDVVAFRGCMQQSFALNPDLPLTWKFRKEKTGGGAIIDIGSHAIDLARYLVGDIDEVCGVLKTVFPKRPLPPKGNNLFWAAKAEGAPMGKVEVDDLASFMCKFHNGAVGTFEVSRVASGKGDGCGFEVWGTKGAIRWDQQMLGQIELCREDDPADQKGFKIIEIGGAHECGLWNVAGFGIGLGDNKSIEIRDVIEAFANGTEFHADFYDGLKVAQIAAAVQRSSETGSWEKIALVDDIAHV